MNRGRLAGGRRTRSAYGNCMAPWPLAPTQPRFTSTRLNISPLDGTGVRPNAKFRFPRPWIRRPCALRIHRSSRIPTWPWKMLDVTDRCRCPPPLRPRVGALFPWRRASPVRPFGLKVQWSAPSRPATLVLPARPETTSGMAIGRLRAMVSGVGSNDLKRIFFFFFFAEMILGEW